MKLTTLLIMTAFLQVSAATYGQKVSLTQKQATLEQIFTAIHQQTGLNVLWASDKIKTFQPQNVNFNDISFQEALDIALKDLPLTYEIQDKTILIKEKQSNIIDKIKTALTPPTTVNGYIADETGKKMPGVTIKVKGNEGVTVTDKDGYYSITAPNNDDLLVFSFIGYETQELRVKDIVNNSVIVLKPAINNLKEVVINKGYYFEKKELSTGNISTVSAKEIEQQPVPNVLQALVGRVPGLVITQATGLPGGGFTIQIRGQNSLFNGNDPFYVIDGVPYASQLPQVQGGGSALLSNSLQQGNPLSYINPDDIESVEVLKDADATSIYGSRAANGAILITTKKGKIGPLSVSAGLTSGYSSPARSIQLLNTQQYLQMRHEAFRNDGKMPTSSNYDVNGIWDTTRYTNWGKVFTQNTSHYTNALLSLSGGNTNTQYLIDGGYNLQGSGMPTLLPGDGLDKRGSLHFNINSQSNDQKFKISLTGSYVADKNTIQDADLSGSRFLAPDAPALYNPDHSLNWAPLMPGQSGTFGNPLAALYNNTKANTANLVSSSNFSYAFLPNLELKSSFGFSNTQIDQVKIYPTIANDPGDHVTSGQAFYQTSNQNNWIIEPQLNYSTHIGQGKLTALIGGTFNSAKSSLQQTQGDNYISDALLGNPQAAGTVSESSNSSQYNYTAIYGRLNYNREDKYLLNLTARRDGSSRFGPGKQFGNFGSAGAAWIFNKEKFIENHLPWLSFGKLRASYGTTGNDGIGDYQFLELYTTTAYPYQGVQGLSPKNLFNPNLSWEFDRQFEAGLELGFLNDRIYAQASYYRKRSNNQLLNTPLSSVTGYSSIPTNLPALVQNSGMEFELHTVNIKTSQFSWSSSFNLSFNRNKLVDFPNFANSGYTNNLEIGKSISQQKVYELAGVNPTTGIYQFYTSTGQLTYAPNSKTDRIAIINTTPQFYGGFTNTFKYKGFALDFLFQFVKQTGLNLFGSFGALPGSAVNMPLEILNRWQKPGDIAPYEQFSQNFSGQAYKELNAYAKQSDYAYGDASFIRLKNVAFSWLIPQEFSKPLHMRSCSLFVQAQNILTITNYNGIDPESQSTGYPPAKLWTAGFRVTF